MANASRAPIAKDYGFEPEVLQAALADIAALESKFRDIVDTAPATVCWRVLDRVAAEAKPDLSGCRGGFVSVDHAVNTFLNRLVGLRSAITTDTDALLAPGERVRRDEAVIGYLEEIRKHYIGTAKQ
ncbi:MAG: hypothetical protein KBC96_12160 [Armatimonadetes bacterium]|nr:hypothetical protein [Armatimonadota bacterium]